ncbi:MAG: HupE/UreJ family protein [Archangiaceae bacterium]|nr:HupE/UreJ family protein [Archangiaceae bacterium]
MSRRALVFGLLVAAEAAAHQASDAYLTLDFRGAPALRVDLALRDLDDQLQLDADGDGNVTWGEVQARLGDVEAELSRHLTVKGCAWRIGRRGLTGHSDGAYLVLEGALDCEGQGAVSVGYSLFFARDPSHRALVRLLTGPTEQTLIATPEKRELVFDAAPQQAASLGQFFVEGVHHILIGADHLLFLTALLLPSVLKRRGRLRLLAFSDFEPCETLKPALVEVVKLVTAFTLAHSLTLALAALDVVELPSRLTESAIAATVVLVAVSNLWSLTDDARWGPAFTLGLVHGFGFSSVLKDSGLRGTSLVAELLGFNLGVECGQLLFVAAVVPVCFGLSRRRDLYPWLARAGSVLIAIIGAHWFWQRAF